MGNQPIEDIKVNKEYDENGNLIRYDSTYTYYYSNIEGDEIAADSIFNNFRICLKTIILSQQRHISMICFSKTAC
ncbi:hypothetical protein LDL59_01710 [Kaistella anthropi]|nr:hypothetical protein [Kaistella anthropi]